MAGRAELSDVEAAGRKRGAPRRRLRLAAAGSGDRAADTVSIVNLSATGMLIETSARFAIGDALQVELPHAGATTASVVWSSDNLFGCRFGKPLSPAAVSAALLKSEPDQRTAPAADDPFPARMKQLREQRGLSLEMLARELGLSRQTVWYWERGRNLPGGENLARLARALQVGEQDLIPGRTGRAAGPAGNLAVAVEVRRAEIARLAGTSEDKVRIVIEF